MNLITSYDVEEKFNNKITENLDLNDIKSGISNGMNSIKNIFVKDENKN
jgi:hypothetical protein